MPLKIPFRKVYDDSGQINLRIYRRVENPGKCPNLADDGIEVDSFCLKLFSNQSPYQLRKSLKKLIMSKFNLSRKLFDFEEYDSDNSDKSVIYISSSEDESSEWETDCSTDTEQLIARIEREVTSSPMLIGGRVMTMDEPEDEARAEPSTSQMEEG